MRHSSIAIVQKVGITTFSAALVASFSIVPFQQVPAQPTVQVERPAHIEDCDAIRREIEKLQQELRNTRYSIRELTLEIEQLNKHISELRDDVKWREKGWGSVLGPVSEIGRRNFLDRLIIVVRYRSLKIKELQEDQDRIVAINKQLADLLKLLKCDTPSTIPPPQPQPQPQPQPPQQVGEAPPPIKLAPADRHILDLHNRERAAVGAPPLQWDPALSATAMAYAAEMARTGKFTHASRDGRGIVRENINQAFHGSSPDQLMANWLNEKRNFVPGTFPNVSRTGNWYDVGHYSQMIWPTTTHVGCGKALGVRWDYFVCRYSPGGNKDGQPVGLPPPAN